MEIPTKEQIQKFQKKIQADPVFFIEKVLGNPLWEKQKEIVEAVRDNSEVAVRSCHASGKSYVSGRIVHWYLNAYSNSIVITTAPTFRQVKEILWREIKGSVRGKKIYPEKSLLDTAINISDNWFALGLSTDRPEQFQGFHCLSDDTEILTEEGWKNVFQLNIKDRVLSVPLGKTNAEWKDIDDIYIYPFEGQLNEYNGKVLNFAVTDEHRFPTKYDSSCHNWSFKKFSELKSKFTIQRKIDWNGNNIKVPNEFKEFDIKRFCEFVGFWTGDGGTRQHSKGGFYEVLFYQTKKRGCDYLENYLLKDLKYSKKQDYYSLCDKNKCRWLLENVGRYGKDRVVPKMFKEATTEIINYYLKGIWEAEGSLRKNGKKGQLFNTSKVLMDNVQEMLLKIGKPTTLGINVKAGYKKLAKNTCYVLSFTENTTDHIVLKKNVKKINYKGSVWCISTKYNTFIARRNGRCFVSGNSPHLMVLVDEASGIQPEIEEAIDGLTPEKIVRIGQPLKTTGRFADSFRFPNVKKMQISAFDTPNIKEGKIVIPGLITSADIEKFKIRYGEDSDVYKVRVLGEFPSQDVNALISIDDVSKAIHRNVDVLPHWEKKMGVDVARFGDDRTAIIIRQMEKVVKKDVFSSLDTMEITGRVLKIAKDENVKPENIYIDVIGIGAGVYDRMKEQGWKVNAVNVAESPEDKENYLNLRAELYAGKVKEWIKDADLLNDDDFYELANIKYKFNSKGQLQIESKEDMKKRGLESPDVADALMLTFASKNVIYIPSQSQPLPTYYTDLGI